MSDTQRKNDFWQRSQSGQSIVILALGFLALLAFVGIVTDVSLMFVRYSTLRRAVDAAAIAAAGQMQRSVDDSIVDSPLTPNINEREAAIQADSYANMSLAARSFIELYGLDPDNVIVETCYSQNVRLMDPRYPTYTAEDAVANSVTDWLPSQPVDRAGNPFYLYNANGEIDRQTGPNFGINPAASRDERLDYEELCTRNELKLVRVTAQIESPTIFLRLFGFSTITLQESAISQTAVLDVVLILDVSESMLEETSYESYQAEGYWHRFFPPQLAYNPAPGGTAARLWDNYLNRTQADILTNVYGGNLGGNNTSTPQFAADPALYAALPADAPADPAEINIIRTECQIQFYPSSGDHRYRVPADIISEYGAVGFNTSLLVSGYSHGFVPAVDYYGCCNDPDGDGDFADLVCQPFREVRNAAENFLDRLDFTRGDRVAFVTFDQQAHLMDPDGTASPYQIGFMETLEDINAPSDSGDRTGALTVLQDRVGVRSEPTYYADADGDGQWDGFRIGGTIQPFSQYDGSGNCVSGACAYYEGTQIYNLRQSPVRGSCFVDGASNDPRFSENDYQETAPSTYITRYTADFRDNTPLDEVITPFTLPDWLIPDVPSQRYMSYEYGAGCRGTNIAASMQSASVAFGEYGRVDGAVWIMVLLSDGAAGATDPILRQPTDGSQPLTAPGASLYNVPSIVNDPLFMLDYERLGFAPEALTGATYGGYGLCPFGTTDHPSELTSDMSFPFCSDERADTRTFCYPPPPASDTRVLQPSSRPINLQVNAANLQPVPPNRNNWYPYTHAYVDPNTTMNPNALPCEQIYDVDDYTRDWADFVALDDFNGGGVSTAIETRLPIIFTIGFGIYDDSLADAVPDELGEEMLRYIADVGDNARLDNDYWQNLMGDRVPLWSVDGYGVRGACEVPSGTPGNWSPLPNGQDCGNYFNAPDGQRLNEVFDQIASRMFTRLAQ
ncbi:MAG: hypothetical protein IAE89_05790 [Anaerolineae bacterium]|nr:hypothetical protein [Anaerolineae bacterium]